MNQVGNPAAYVEVVAWTLLTQLVEKWPGLFGLEICYRSVPRYTNSTLLSRKEQFPYALGASCLFFERYYVSPVGSVRYAGTARTVAIKRL
jgi:hypothetical protein